MPAAFATAAAAESARWSGAATVMLTVGLVLLRVAPPSTEDDVVGDTVAFATAVDRCGCAVTVPVPVDVPGATGGVVASGGAEVVVDASDATDDDAVADCAEGVTKVAEGAVTVIVRGADGTWKPRDGVSVTGGGRGARARALKHQLPGGTVGITTVGTAGSAAGAATIGVVGNGTGEQPPAGGVDRLVAGTMPTPENQTPLTFAAAAGAT